MSEIYKEYSGSEFNKYHIYRNKGETKFYKFLNDNLTHNGFKYQLGLNTDTNRFNPRGECYGGGLYFCDKDTCYLYYHVYGSKLAVVEIPDDARVYVEKDKFKANKIILREINDFDDVDDEFWINVSYKNGHAIRYVKNQSYELCASTVKRKGLTLKHVKDQNEEICILAVRQNGEALQHVKKQTDKICFAAIKMSPAALCYVNKQTQELCTLAVELDSSALKYVDIQFKTNDLCYLAKQSQIEALRKLLNH